VLWIPIANGFRQAAELLPEKNSGMSTAVGNQKNTVLSGVFKELFHESTLVRAGLSLSRRTASHNGQTEDIHRFNNRPAWVFHTFHRFHFNLALSGAPRLSVLA